MVLQNRVTPFGDIITHRARGEFLGNRGGRFHDGSKKLLKRHWRSKAWLICVLDFKGRSREVMGHGYTELFFLDEATALAAGHRPCFECRRTRANAFKSAWATGNGWETAPTAPQMDTCLHQDRCAVAGTDHLILREAAQLPDGVFVVLQGRAWLISNGFMLRWTPKGYDKICRASGAVSVLTPVATVAALAAGYRPHIHVSAGRLQDRSTAS